MVAGAYLNQNSLMLPTIGFTSARLELRLKQATAETLVGHDESMEKASVSRSPERAHLVKGWLAHRLVLYEI